MATYTVSVGRYVRENKTYVSAITDDIFYFDSLLCMKSWLKDHAYNVKDEAGLLITAAVSGPFYTGIEWGGTPCATSELDYEVECSHCANPM